MLKMLFDQGIFFIAVCVFTGVALINRWKTCMIYRHLIRQASRLGDTRNKVLHKMKNQYENNLRIGRKVLNVRDYEKNCLESYRFMGITLRGQNKIFRLAVLSAFTTCVVGTYLSYFTKRPKEETVLYMAAGIISVVLACMGAVFFDVSGKKEILLTRLGDEMENVLYNRIVTRADSKRELEKKEEAAEEEVGDILRDRYKISDDDDKLIKEVIEEYLS